MICTWFFELLQATYTGSNNRVGNRPKIKFVQHYFSNLIFQKSSADQQGESLKPVNETSGRSEVCILIYEKTLEVTDPLTSDLSDIFL